jgi:outer membrane murein-binding lipoprotein Lpp
MGNGNLEIILEDMNSKFSLILESHAALQSQISEVSRKADERFDLLDFKIDTLNKKIDAVSTDLSAHRADTEAHHGIYRVKES